MEGFKFGSIEDTGGLMTRSRNNGKGPFIEICDTPKSDPKVVRAHYKFWPKMSQGEGAQPNESIRPPSKPTRTKKGFAWKTPKAGTWKRANWSEQMDQDPFATVTNLGKRGVFLWVDRRKLEVI